MVVAVIGAGIDYRRTEVAQRLARDGEGEMIGWDVIADDPRPLEAVPPLGLSMPPSAGTRAAMILLGEAGATSLVPVRVPDGSLTALASGLAFVARTPAGVSVVLPTPERRAVVALC